MSNFDIETYLNSRPDNIKCIDVSNKGITYLPDLTRFKNLKALSCFHNNLKSLPTLPENLTYLSCFNNELTCFL
jgi:Leucine-rich repeat (LRR) protein